MIKLTVPWIKTEELKDKLKIEIKDES